MALEYSSFVRRLGFALCCGWLVWGSAIRPAVAQAPAEPSVEPAAALQAAQSEEVAGASSGLEVTAGFDGVWKLGQVCPIRVRLSEALRSTAAEIRVQTVDGDGVEVTYRQPLSPTSTDATGDTSVWIPIRSGRRDYAITTQIIDGAGALLAEQSIDSVAANILDSDQPFLLAIGSAMGVEELSRTSADGTKSTFTTQVITQASLLPPNWYDYSACDVLLISTADPEMLAQLGPAWDGIDRWIRRGGNCILSLDAESVDSWQQLPALQSLLPGPVAGTGRISDPGLLESLVATDDPLGRFTAVVLEPQQGQVEMTFTDSLAKRVPWWIRYPHGHGSVQTLATDLDHTAFAEWDDRKQLWGRLITPYFDETTLEGNFSAKQISDSSYLGYSDIVGQLRATLDVFPSRTVISFGQVTALLLGIVILIGPVDYLISVRWLKRPDLSWYFAGVVLLLACIALSWLYSSIRPDRIRVNTAQILDIDLADQTLNGHLWSHVFAGNAHVVDIQFDRSQLGAESRADTSADADPANIPFMDWQGLPGSGLGGLESQLNTSHGMPAYTIDVGVAQPAVRGVGIAPAGTKGVAVEWVDEIDVRQEFNLSELSGVDQLTGEFSNPFDVDIKDAYLMYHNWYYRLNSRIPAGSRVTISSDTIPKDIARKLNERTSFDNRSGSNKWDPADRDSIDRLLEMMMFYDAATGRKYTSLAHRFQPLLDQSNLLETNYAIMVGRLDTPPVKLDVQARDAPNTEVVQDMDRVWCRLIIPVKK